jgi:hypothetical protein
VRTLATIFSILAVALSLEQGSAGGGELMRAGSDGEDGRGAAAL